MLKKISFVAMFFLALSINATDFGPQQISLKSCTGYPQFAVNFNTTPLLLSATAVSNPVPNLSDKIRTGKTLGAIGTASWAAGKTLEIVGLSILFAGPNESAMTGVGLLIPGLFLDLFGAIPSCAGESIVMRSIKESNIVLSDRDFEVKPKGWSIYGASWGLLGAGALFEILAATTKTLPLVFVGMAASLTAEVLRGVSAIAPLVRVRKAGRRISTRLSPVINGNGGAGLSFVFGF